MIRAFIAAALPPAMGERLAGGAAAARARGPEGRWTPADRRHLTLAFLGEIPADVAARVGEALTGLAARDPVPVRPGGTGGFPVPARATVLWAGVEGGEGLPALAAAVAAMAVSAGAVPPDDRPFVPHITIARFRRPRDIRAIDLWGGRGDTGDEACLLSRVVLMESRLSPAGPSYTALRDIRLAGGEHAGP